MDEDEECLPEKSSLNAYLNHLGFSDVQIFKDKTETSANKLFLANDVSVIIDEDVLDKMKVLISSRLLFEDDLSILEVVLSNYRMANVSLIKSIFSDLSTGFVFFLGWSLYYVIGYFAFVLTSPFYAYKCANYFIRKKFVNTELKELHKALRNTTAKIKNCVNFITSYNSNNIIQNKSSMSLVEIVTYVRYRSSLYSCLNKMINILVASTQRLIKNVPLVDYADTTEYYLCVNFVSFENSLNKCDDPIKMHNVYLLLQSEFLRRLILSLIPNLYKFPKQNNIQRLDSIVRSTRVQLTAQLKTLLKTYDFLIHIKNVSESELILKPTPGREYLKELACSIEKLSSISQSLLVKWKIYEENNICDKNFTFLEDSLIKMQNSINDCQRNINNTFILLKKAKDVVDPAEDYRVQHQENLDSGQKNLEVSSNKTINVESEDGEQEMAEFRREENEEDENKIKVGYTDLDRTFEDDVFEAYISNENEKGEFNPDVWDLDELSKKKLQRDFSQNVMVELKGKLVEKAKNWKEREVNVLKKKGLINDNNEELLKDENNEVEKEIVEKKENRETFYEEVQSEVEDPSSGSFDFEAVNKSFEDIRKEINRKKKKRKKSKPKQEDLMQTDFHGPNKEFLKSLFEARNSILKSPQPEEDFFLSAYDVEEI